MRMLSIARMLFTTFLISFSTVLLLLGLCTGAEAEKLVYIFDASGSMWGQVDGVAKIEIAKEALSDLITKIPPDSEVGLVVYGHRREKDCSDIEELVPLGRPDAQAMVAAVQSIQPKGMTPMAASVRLVAERFRASGEKGDIILISDGKETCDADPCELVRSLRQAGIRLTLHVIGFDVGGETEQQLRCMAQAGGGQYFAASNAADFAQATQGAQALVGDNLKVGAKRSGKPFAADVFVVASATGATVDNRTSGDKEPAGFRVEPGVYDLRIVDAWGQEGAPEQWIRGVQVEDGKIREVVAEFGGGVLEVRALRNGNLFGADVLVTDANGKTVSRQSTTEGPARFELASGEYAVKVKDEWGSGAEQFLGKISIGSGVTTREVAFDTGTLHVWAYRGGKIYVADVYVLEPGGSQVDNMATREDQPVAFELLPGSYRIRVKDEWGDGSVRESDIVIQPGEVVELKVDFDG